MALQFCDPRNTYMLPASVINHAAVIGHLREVLNSFAAKSEYSMFYIGITSNLDTRLNQHKVNKPTFQLMCPIYEESGNLVENAFDRLERTAIATFRDGIFHPDKSKRGTPPKPELACCNGVGGSRPKNTLYILVG
ncbi:MAG: GIY-YIG nuclease family protein [Burkholderia gladioli]